MRDIYCLEHLEARVLLSSSPLPDIGDESLAGSLPQINVWYGQTQYFGQEGNPQRWVNILGDVSDDQGISSLAYSLNGASQKSCVINPYQNVRIEKYGDFNIEIDNNNLCIGENLLDIIVRDIEGNITQTQVRIFYNNPDQPDTSVWVDFSQSSSIPQSIQIVDGLWTIEGNSIRTVETGYDRMFAIGDMSWDDFEITADITVNSWDNPANWSDSTLTPAVGIVIRWDGHYQYGSETPATRWWPVGALGWYSQASPQQDSHSMLLYRKGTLDKEIAEIITGQTYTWKLRAETQDNGYTIYKMKYWASDQIEPEQWNLSAFKYYQDLRNGSAGFIAHNADVSFSNISIISLNEPVIPPDPPQNIPPVANDDQYQTNQDTPLTVNVQLGLLANDTDANGDPITAVKISNPQNGTLDMLHDGRFTYTPNEGFFGTDSFTYKAYDAKEYSQPAIVTITVKQQVILPPVDQEITSWADVGNPAINGSMEYEEISGVYTLQAAGADIWGTSDQFGFAYFEISGNFSISAQVLSLSNTHPWAKAGVMIRETLDANARHVTTVVSAENGIASQFRNRTARVSDSVAGLRYLAAPSYWVKIVRVDDTITSYQSSDGQNWETIYSAAIGMSQTVYAGLALTSHDELTVTSAQFANVVIEML